MTNLSRDARRKAGNPDAHPHPQEILMVARIIKRTRDQLARNKLAIGLAETLHEIPGFRFNEKALLDLCSYDPAIGGNTRQAPLEATADANGRPNVGRCTPYGKGFTGVEPRPRSRAEKFREAQRANEAAS